MTIIIADSDAVWCELLARELDLGHGVSVHRVDSRGLIEGLRQSGARLAAFEFSEDAESTLAEVFKIREDPDLWRKPIVAVTHRTERGLMEASLDRGISAYFSKSEVRIAHLAGELVRMARHHSD